MGFKRIKTITSHAGYGRFLSECDLEDDEGLKPVAWIARCQRSAIPSPYAYSASNMLLRWNGKTVLVSEVSHKRYEVYEVAPQVKRFASDEAAAEYNARMGRNAA